MATGQKRLQDSDLLLSILDNLPTSIFVKNEDMTFVYSNKMHCEIIGLPESELLGRSDADFYDQDLAGGFIERDRAVILSGESNLSEELASRRDGVTKPVLTRKSRLMGPDGNLYLLGTNTDISELKRRDEQNRAIADTVPVGVMQIEESGKVSFANALSITTLGFSETPSIKVLNEIFGGQHTDFPGAKAKFEIDVHVSNRENRRLLVCSSGWLRTAGKRGRSAIISIVDLSEMTQLRRVNEEILRLNFELADTVKRLKEMQDELVKRQRMEQLGQLTATVAHELRNPLGAVRTSTFLLERKLAGKEHGVEMQIQRITNGVNRCDNIITQLLDFSRGKKIEAEPAEFDSWLEKIIEEERRRLPQSVRIEQSLGLKDRVLPFDGPRIQRAIINLMSNACEAMVGDGRDSKQVVVANPVIKLTTGIEGGMACISVVDNGPGIPENILAKVREPLFTTKSFGTGLGIPAVEQIANLHGGSLEIRSEAGKGATVIIRLPLQNSVEAAA
jgi:PAS domain S-box-containing protein